MSENMNIQNMTEAEKSQQFKSQYTDVMIRNGRLTTLVAALLTWLPALYLWFGLGLRPEWNQILAGWGIIASAYFLIYIFEPLGYYPAMGTTGLYIGYLSGNVPSVRLPAMLAAQMATNAEPGTKKGEVVGVIAMGVSVFTNLFFVTLAAVSGVWLLEVLPPFFINAFDFCLPAILGGVMAQYWKKEKVFVPLIFVLCLIIEYLPIASILKFPGAILLSIVLGYFFYQQRKKKGTV